MKNLQNIHAVCPSFIHSSPGRLCNRAFCLCTCFGLDAVTFINIRKIRKSFICAFHLFSFRFYLFIYLFTYLFIFCFLRPEVWPSTSLISTFAQSNER